MYSGNRRSSWMLQTEELLCQLWKASKGHVHLWSFVYLSQYLSEQVVPLALNGPRLRKSRWHGQNWPFIPLILSGFFRVDKKDSQKDSGRKNCSQNSVSQWESGSLTLKPHDLQKMSEKQRKGVLKSMSYPGKQKLYQVLVPVQSPTLFNWVADPHLKM